MSLNSLNEKLEASEIYQFSQRHKKVINIIQGLIIIGLLISINIYVVKDFSIKKQIAENCGYTTSKYTCVCEEHYAENWKDLRDGKLNINFSESDVPMVG
jgi:hypothetical protein